MARLIHAGPHKIKYINYLTDIKSITIELVTTGLFYTVCLTTSMIVYPSDFKKGLVYAVMKVEIFWEPGYVCWEGEGSILPFNELIHKLMG